MTCCGPLVEGKMSVSMPGTEAKVVEVPEEARKNVLSIQWILSGSSFLLFLVT